MLGPVFRQELLVAGRRHQPYFLRWTYAALLLVQLLPRLLLGRPVGPGGDAYVRYFESFLSQHLGFLLILTPALAAGAITDEKTRRTLDDLLTSGLRPAEIVLGKLAARVYQVAVLSLVGLPVVCFLGTLSQLDPGVPLALMLVSVVVAVGAAALSVLASVWCRHTRDAVLLTYLSLLGAFALAGAGDAAGLAGLAGLADALSPWHALALDAPAARWGRLAWFAPAWLGLAAGCALLACWRLRPAHERQQRGPAPGAAPGRWLRPPPPVFGNPVLWREWFVQGAAPFARLRLVPWWLAAPAALGLSAAALTGMLLDVSLADLWDLLHGNGDRLVDAALRLRFRRADVAGPFFLHAFGAFLLLTVLVAVRASGCIGEERERGTWAPLLLTPLSTRQIVWGKYLGVLAACLPYLLAYAVSAPPLAALAGGLEVAPMAGALVVLIGLAVAVVGAVGLACSASLGSTWRSLLVTLTACYAGFVLLTIPFCAVACVVGCGLAAVLAPLRPAARDASALAVIWLGAGLQLLFPLIVAAAVVYAALSFTEGYIHRRERVRARPGADAERKRRALLEMEEERGWDLHHDPHDEDD